MHKFKDLSVGRRYFWVKGSQELVFSLLNEEHEEFGKIRAHFPKVWESKSWYEHNSLGHPIELK